MRSEYEVNLTLVPVDSVKVGSNFHKPAPVRKKKGFFAWLLEVLV
jgi:hypothetical protein